VFIKNGRKLAISEEPILQKELVTMLVVTEEASGPTLLEFNLYKLDGEQKRRFHFNRAV
jgi:hypothetical protein